MGVYSGMRDANAMCGVVTVLQLAQLAKSQPLAQLRRWAQSSADIEDSGIGFDWKRNGFDGDCVGHNVYSSNR